MRLSDRLIYKLYLATMRFESMAMLPVRRRIFDRLLKRKHKRLNIHAHVFIGGWWGISFGDNVTLNRYCNIAAHGGLTIGDDVAIAPSVKIWTTEHEYSGEGPIQDQPISLHPVTIGNDVWIGLGAIILGGVSLASGTIVGAGSVVTKPFIEPHTTIAGNPAKVIRRRLDQAH